MSIEYTPQPIAVALSVMTGDKHFLVFSPDNIVEPILPLDPYNGDLPTLHIAYEILRKHTGINLSVGRWAVMRQVGFFETPLYDHRTVLFGVELPERVPLLVPEAKWINFDTLQDIGPKSTVYALFMYASGAMRV